ncbi:MAG: UDP-N-acetylglucosamine 2-epimerase (non-hydrolyzing) [bacterium]|nr:UDP-N-acetylglucosamine 2-epimerase (non-hydrolyzing) [bacterium]
MKTWIIAVGARPNYMKAGPLLKELSNHPGIHPILVHTGQHYSEELSDVFFRELRIPAPDINLGVGPGSHAAQTARVMKRFEEVLMKKKPQLVIVVGDVNSTLACALTAAKMHIKVAHVEAGLRSFDKTMPEEINRKLTDMISDFLFTTEPSAETNLLKEGIDKNKIFFTGNTMIDTLLDNLDRAGKSQVLYRSNLGKKTFAVLTLHRPSNVDKKEDLLKIREALVKLSDYVKIVFPAHPRTIKQALKMGVDLSFLTLAPPMNYLDFIHLVNHSRFVLTDSGGIQEETSILGVPCLTLRENTERPITVEQGTNTVTGTSPQRIFEAFEQVLTHNTPTGKANIKFWDGKAARRIIKILKEAL